MEKAVAKYDKEQISKNRAVGELNHPEGNGKLRQGFASHQGTQI